MGRRSTIPDLFDDCKTVSITKLKACGYLQICTQQWGNITWSRNEQQTAAISFSIIIDRNWGMLTFDYNCDKEPIKYHVDIISKRSNLGNGLLWFFVCPKTGKHCRILHLASKHFLHRTAFKSYMYEVQTMSKNTRGLTKTLYKSLIDEKYYEEMYSKHFKKYYNGKPTKRYLSLLSKVGERPGNF
jgi:hypothetical protein